MWSVSEGRRRLGPALLLAGALGAAGCEPKSPGNAAAPVVPPPSAAEKPFDANTLDVPFLATPDTTVAAMLDLGGLKAGDFVIDLGSGDGRILITAAQRGATGFGVDIDPKRIAEAELNARRAGVADKVSFRRQDLFDTPISQATLLTMYLLPEVNLRLRPRILNELAPGTRVVSHAFDMGGWRPDATGDNGGVFMWIVPAKVGGAWRVSGGGVDGALVLTQRFQDIEGTLAGRPIREAAMRGDRISFIAPTPAGDRLFSGVVAGGQIRPIEAFGAPAQQVATGWRATRP